MTLVNQCQAHHNQVNPGNLVTCAQGNQKGTRTSTGSSGIYIELTVPKELTTASRSSSTKKKCLFSIFKTGRRVKIIPCFQQPATGAVEKLYLTPMIAIIDSTQ